MNNVLDIIVAIIISSSSSPAELTSLSPTVHSVAACKATIQEVANMSFGRTVDAKCIDAGTGQRMVQIRCVKAGFFSTKMECAER
jgi:hypothetical protein